jgi:hypothetical protein
VGESGAVDAPAQPVGAGERQDADMGEQMKTYKDGLLEAAKVAENTVCDVHLPTGVKIYGQVAARVIRALAAQEDQRSEAERIADSRSKSSTQSSDHPTTADSDTPRTDKVWGSMHGSGYQMMLLAQKLERELAAVKEKYLQVCAQHGRLVDQVFEEDGETLKHIAAEVSAAAANDLLRECFDWGLPEDLKERIDAAMGEKK